MPPNCRQAPISSPAIGGRPITNGPPLVSFDAELAQGMGLQVGDTLSVNLLAARSPPGIASLRRIDWAAAWDQFRAGVFARHAGSRATDPSRRGLCRTGEAEEALVRRVTERFPNVSAIPVREGPGRRRRGWWRRSAARSASSRC